MSEQLQSRYTNHSRSYREVFLEYQEKSNDVPTEGFVFEASKPYLDRTVPDKSSRLSMASSINPRINAAIPERYAVRR